VPFYPWFPIIALVIASVSLIAMITLNLRLAFIFLGLLALSYIWFHLAVKNKLYGNTAEH
jgi:ethanolamine permease